MFGYNDLIVDMESIKGFFDFYIDNKKVYISIKPEQLNEEFLITPLKFPIKDIFGF